MPKKKDEEMLNSVFGKDEETLLQKGKNDIFYLWRWSLPRLLCGKNIEKALQYVKSQIDSFTPALRADVALKDWLQLAALLELFDESSEEFIQKAEKYLNLQTALNAENNRLIESALAISVYLNNRAETEKWRQAALHVPLEIGAEYILFELIFLTDSEIIRNIDLEKMTNTVTRVIYKVLMSAPFYSSAPHILVLDSIARTCDKRLADLLKGQVKKLDEKTFDANGNLLIDYGKLKKTVFKDRNEVILSLTATAQEVSEIDTSYCDASALTYYLPTVLVELAENDKLTPDTKIFARLILEKKVSISEEETEILKKRFNLALKMTENQVGFPIVNRDLTIINQVK